MGSFIIFFCNPIIVLLELRKKINGFLRNKYLQTFWKCFLSRNGNSLLSMLIIWEFTTQDPSRVCAVQPHNCLQIKSTNSRFQTYKRNSKSQTSFYIITKGDADFLFLNGLSNKWSVYQYLYGLTVAYSPPLPSPQKEMNGSWNANTINSKFQSLSFTWSQHALTIRILFFLAGIRNICSTDTIKYL